MPVTFNKAGKIESISIYHNGGTGNVLMGVYADQAGLPSSQLGKTVSTVISSTSGWQTVSLTSPVQVNAGQTVWLSWVFQNNPGIRYSVGKPGRAQSSQTWSGGMPTSFGQSEIANYTFSVYCTYRSITVDDITKKGIVQEDVLIDENVLEEEQVITQLTNTDELFNNLKIDVYPNPASNNVTIRFSELPEDGTRITIFDMTGREVQSRIVQNTLETFDIQALKQGIYIVKTELFNNIHTQKLIKR
ncbi:MAG: T9SS type A sorting domain-containing protein [Draconibacterium sp.]|nr:T9SS type A sorting domain-containing protein [Draconibacterium sp.]